MLNKQGSFLSPPCYFQIPILKKEAPHIWNSHSSCTWVTVTVPAEVYKKMLHYLPRCPSHDLQLLYLQRYTIWQDTLLVEVSRTWFTVTVPTKVYIMTRHITCWGAPHSKTPPHTVAQGTSGNLLWHCTGSNEVSSSEIQYHHFRLLNVLPGWLPLCLVVWTARPNILAAFHAYMAPVCITADQSFLEPRRMSLSNNYSMDP